MAVQLDATSATRLGMDMSKSVWPVEEGRRSALAFLYTFLCADAQLSLYERMFPLRATSSLTAYMCNHEIQSICQCLAFHNKLLQSCGSG